MKSKVSKRSNSAIASSALFIPAYMLTAYDQAVPPNFTPSSRATSNSSAAACAELGVAAESSELTQYSVASAKLFAAFICLWSRNKSYVTRLASRSSCESLHSRHAAVYARCTMGVIHRLFHPSSLRNSSRNASYARKNSCTAVGRKHRASNNAQCASHRLFASPRARSKISPQSLSASFLRPGVHANTFAISTVTSPPPSSYPRAMHSL
mmetsp:Transcript_4072/g.15713  ORF Transcript_4072/g.15713 Transcript_4072/m.15713 type:complete len:210 (-) Transcript_4072:530-1159(-)